jgi:hypothetical protein
MNRRRARVLPALALWALAAQAALLSPSAGAVAPRPTGCQPGWPVVAHLADGTRVRFTGKLPVPCAMPTRYATSETTIAIAPDGNIFFSPANTENTIAHSSDGGAFWTLSAPQQLQYTSLWNTTDPWITVDRRTGRVFWVRATGELRTAPVLVDESPLGWQAPQAFAYAHGFQVYSSSDDGLNWTTADDRTQPTGDWEKIFVGPPPASGPKPIGYPDVVYVCANAPFEVTGPGRDCYRSLDGGQTFSLAGTVAPTAVSPHDDCPPLAGGANGGVASDGAFYQPQSCATESWVAVSHDEATSWSWYPIPGAPTSTGLSTTSERALQLALDDSNNLYVMWGGNQSIDLEISRDGGRSWSPAMSIHVPGLHYFDLPALAAGPAGHVAVAYCASASSTVKQLSAYITETTNALTAHPVFVTAALNDPARPIFEDYGLSGGATPRADFIGATYDSEGNVWAGLVKQFGAPNSAGVVATTGYVGALEMSLRHVVPVKHHCVDPVDRDGDHDPGAPPGTKNLCRRPDDDSGRGSHHRAG